MPVKYGSDYQLARRILYQVAEEVVGDYASYAQQVWDQMVRKYLIEKARIEPAVTLTANDNWVEFTLRYVVDFKKRRSAKDQLFTRLLEEIDRVPERVGIASATFQLVQAPALEVKLSSSTGRAPALNLKDNLEAGEAKQTGPKQIEDLRRRVEKIEAQLVDLQARLPGHSLPPALMAQWDDLDEALALARLQLAEAQDIMDLTLRIPRKLQL